MAITSEERNGNNRKFLILGIGNILLKDEGLGVRAIEYLRERFHIPPQVSILDGGTLGLALLSIIKEFNHIIVIDAVSSNGSPGTIYRIPANELPMVRPLMTSLHQFGVRDLLAIASLQGYNPDVVIIGMEPLDISPGLELTELIKERLPVVVDLVREELQGFGVSMVER